MEVFQIWPAALWAAAVLVGLVIGSFLNVVAHRLPIMMERAWKQQCAELAPKGCAPDTGDVSRFDLLWPPSACPACGHRIAAHHNIPVIGYLWLRGRCHWCRAKISVRYPLVEALTAVLSLVVAIVFGATWQLVVALFFTWSLIALTLIDLDHQLLPDSITLPLLWAGLLVSLISGYRTPLFADLPSSVLGAAVGYAALWSIYHLFRLITGKEGMGYGDFKLLAAIGAWLGWQMLPLVILLSAGVGAFVGSIVLMATRQSRLTPIPFGPFLAAAGWIAMLWGQNLVDWYLATI